MADTAPCNCEQVKELQRELERTKLWHQTENEELRAEVKRWTARIKFLELMASESVKLLTNTDR